MTVRGEPRHDDATALRIRFSDEPRRVLAQRYGCTVEAIRQIQVGLTYRHLQQRPATGSVPRCDDCQHWHGLEAAEPCDLGHQDWREEGMEFGGDCATWRGQGSSFASSRSR
jgi:hypothetical protein